ncbi:extracellular solute-binding protein [Paenibacillus sp. HB172176]|uniref:extracellular solute-binding protein n=1 Tax=Paenibacillus sp. HB172176 TaxID=2493690 RepID=UPI001F0E9BED|nr:extracellular solute-binding protein [Paenibacillus sp. HB172176]
MKKWKAGMSLAMSAALTATMLAACSNDNANSNNSEASAKPGESAQTDGKGEASYPDKLSYWVELDGDSAASLTNFDEVGAYKELEKMTGTKVEFKHPGGDSAQVKEQFNLMVASGNLPDVIQTNWLTVPRGPQNAIKEGTIIRLNELIDEYAPNFKAFLEENPDIANMIKTDDGDIYAFPFIRGDDRLKVYYGPIMREDWLEKLHLEQPTTIEEWEQVLTAFLNDDPNGNGKKDEVPFLLETGSVRNESLNQLIGGWGILSKFYQVDGVVKYGELQPEYKDFISTLNDWYNKGLIDKDFPAVDGKLKDAKITGNTLGAFYGFASGSIGKYMDLMKDDPSFKLAPVVNPSLQEGENAAAGQISATYPGEHSAAITTAAKNPEQIVKWLDLGYSEEGSMLFNFGIEGESYTMVDGVPTYTDVITNNPDGLAFKQAQARYMRTHFGGPFNQDVGSFLQQMRYPEQLTAIENWSKADNTIQLPPVTLTAEESGELASIMNDINTYSDELIIKFILGVEPLTEFSKYVDNLKTFGIDKAIAIEQAALDRYNNR